MEGVIGRSGFASAQCESIIAAYKRLFSMKSCPAIATCNRHLQSPPAITPRAAYRSRALGSCIGVVPWSRALESVTPLLQYLLGRLASVRSKLASCCSAVGLLDFGARLRGTTPGGDSMARLQGTTPGHDSRARFQSTIPDKDSGERHRRSIQGKS